MCKLGFHKWQTINESNIYYQVLMWLKDNNILINGEKAYISEAVWQVSKIIKKDNHLPWTLTDRVCSKCGECDAKLHKTTENMYKFYRNSQDKINAMLKTREIAEKMYEEGCK